MVPRQVSDACRLIPPTLVRLLAKKTRESGREIGIGFSEDGEVLGVSLGGPHSVAVPASPITLHTHPTAPEIPSLMDRLSYFLHGEKALCVVSAATGKGACYWSEDRDNIKERLNALATLIAQFNRRWQRGERDMEEGKRLLRERNRLLQEVARAPMLRCQLS